VSAKFASTGELIVLTVTFSIEYDGYLPLYIGWFFEMFAKTPFHLLYFDISRMVLGSEQAATLGAEEVIKATTSFVQGCAACDGARHCPECEDYHMLKFAAFAFNPQRLAIVIMRDSIFKLEMCNYKGMRRAVGHRVPVVMHMNDEMPWVPLDGCAQDVVLDTYRSSQLTIRNYYYNATNEDSLYFPLGSGRMAYNKYLKSNHYLSEMTPKPASQRTFICSFAGRANYRDAHSDGAEERRSFMAALEGLQTGPGPACYGMFSDMDKDFVPNHGLDFNAYFNVMLETIFAPCPGGNNPETFRHYEALEAGAIPLLIKIKRSDRDFLQTWEGYPGPVFESWAELGPFLQAVNGRCVSVSVRVSVRVCVCVCVQQAIYLYVCLSKYISFSLSLCATVVTWTCCRPGSLPGTRPSRSASETRSPAGWRGALPPCRRRPLLLVLGVLVVVVIMVVILVVIMVVIVIVIVIVIKLRVVVVVVVVVVSAAVVSAVVSAVVAVAVAAVPRARLPWRGCARRCSLSRGASRPWRGGGGRERGGRGSERGGGK
jgi:hypothetical protein